MRIAANSFIRSSGKPEVSSRSRLLLSGIVPSY
jgi:hypothetical protein